MSNSSPVRSIVPRLEATASPGQPAGLPDELLVEILVRISSPADLVRASTACVSFHHLITDPTFLRRYRSLHPPLLLGFVRGNEEGFQFQPAEAPHPSAAAGRAMARAADFSFNYVPRGRWGGWYHLDARDGLILLESPAVANNALPDLAVCDPLSRRYLLLPPIPDSQVYEQNLQFRAAFFVPSAGENDEASFRVIMEIHCTTDLVIFVFSSGPGTGSWSAGASTSWDTLSFSSPAMHSMLGWPSYAYGCFYWPAWWGNKLVKLLHMDRMEFSTVDLPPDHAHEPSSHSIIVEAADGKLGLFSPVYCEASLYYYTSMQNEGRRANEWQMKNIIPMPNKNCDLQFVSAPQRYIFITGYGNMDRTWFTLDIC